MASRLLIGHQCPQCGAPAVLTETHRLFECEYCRVKSYLVPPEFFRYVLPHNAPKNRKLLYYPYWRLKGMLFSCASKGIQNRFVDISRQALPCPYFPFSAGLRPQVGKLGFAMPDTPGHFLPVAIAPDDPISEFKNSNARKLPRPVYFQSYVGQTLSLIYAPFYAASRLHDAVLNEPITPDLPDDLAGILDKTETIKKTTRFVPAICPACGWDLSGGREAVTLLCHNCDSAWQPASKAFTRLPFACLKTAGGRNSWLPFWQIRAEITEVRLKTLADLIGLANLPRMVRKEDHSVRFHFWVPAFKIQPRAFLRLARQLTVTQPEDIEQSPLPTETIQTINLSPLAAAAAMKIILAGFIKPAQTYFPLLDQIQITPRQTTLVFIPFSEGHHEFIQTELKLGIRKTLLKLAKNLTNS